MQTPQELSDKLLELAEESSRLGSELSRILTLKPDIWMEMRKSHSSDKSTDKQWDATEEGKKEMQVRLQLKSNQMMMSAIKTKLRVLSDETHNMY